MTIGYGCRIGNLCSAIVAGVRKIEALVDDRKVRHDIARHGPDQRRPVLEARVSNLDSGETTFVVRLDPVQAFPSPAFSPAEGGGVCRQDIREGGQERSLGQALESLTQD